MRRASEGFLPTGILSPKRLSFDDGTEIPLDAPRPVLQASPPSKNSRTRKLELSWVQAQFPVLDAAVKSPSFEAISGVVILANCVTMGMEADQLLGRGMVYKELVAVSEHIFTALFTVELCLRLAVFGWRSHLPTRNLWNFGDAMLVVFTGILPTWVMPILNFEGTAFLQMLTILRALRLIRLARAAQRIESFHDVWVIVRGLAMSMRLLSGTLLVIGFINYVFAIFGVVLYSREIQTRLAAQREELEALENAAPGAAGSAQALARVSAAMEDLQMLDQVTGSVTSWMFSLTQVLTQDSWSGISRLFAKYGLRLHEVFFLGYMAVVTVVMWNVVTALIVETATASRAEDAAREAKMREELRAAELAHLRSIFVDMDTDGNGELTWEEFELALEDKDIAIRLRIMGVDRNNCKEIFDLLDAGDGIISIEEFFEGIQKIDGVALSKDLMHYDKMLSSSVKMFKQKRHEIKEDLEELKLCKQALPAEKTCEEPPPDLGNAAAQLPQKAPAGRAPDARKLLGCPSLESDVSFADDRPRADTNVSDLRFEDDLTLEALLRKVDEVAGLVVESQQELSSAGRTLLHGVGDFKASIPKAPASAFRTTNRFEGVV